MATQHGSGPYYERNHCALLYKRATESEEAGIKVSEIGNLLNVASPTVTQQIKSLETHGFVERNIDKEDRRAVRVTLTDSGLCVVQVASDNYLASVNGLVEYLGEEDSKRLADLLQRVFFYFSEANPSGSNQAQQPEVARD